MDKPLKSWMSDRRIEAQANDLLRAMWQNRNALWNGNPPSNPVELIDPARTLEQLGFSFSYADDLGKYDGENGFMHVAGLIDRDAMSVRISTQLPACVQLFTAAHELGHAVLHDVSGTIHRDRPMDGAVLSRERMEVEADKFAACFLMPAKLLASRFFEIFATEQFDLNEETAFALRCESLAEVRKKCRSRRELSRLLASSSCYNWRFFPSLANQFRVSIETMAIRLEELSLVKG